MIPHPQTKKQVKQGRASRSKLKADTQQESLH
jgi:hypothetical protein